MPTTQAPLLTVQEVADLLRVTVRTVQRMEADRTLLPVRIGRAVRYRREDVQAFLDQQQATA
jgi:excisionase family DNA binding protein